MSKLSLIPLGESEYNELPLQAVAVLPWGGHNLLMLDKGLDSKQVMFYANDVIAKGWSRG